jgi:homoserine O-acetyltransferase/O-succinyltransferase
MKSARSGCTIGVTLLLLALATPAPAPAAPPPLTPQEGTFVARDFKFQSGEVLPEVRLHYLTLGTPQRDAAGRISNAVLLLHGTTGQGKNYLVPSIAGELFGLNQPLDAERFYIIMPDGLGRGGSSKPSDGLRARFPRYGYQDVVAAQHLLVTQGLGVEHLRLVLGTSMGGMQTYLWGERYPDMMDALMPITSQPVQMSGRNLLWRRALTEAIRHDPDWNGGNYQAQPRHWVYSVPIFTIMINGAPQLQKEGPTRKQAEEHYDRIVENARKSYDANDFLYWFESSWDYDPEPELGKIKAKLFSVNFAGDLINPSDLDTIQRLVPKIPRGRFVIVPESDKTAAHQTQTRAAAWRPYLEQLLATP